jgi:hypothetical protein
MINTRIISPEKIHKSPPKRLLTFDSFLHASTLAFNPLLNWQEWALLNQYNPDVG